MNSTTKLILEMARRRIFLVNESQLQEYQQKWIKKYFEREVLPHITPFLMSSDTDVLSFLKDEHSYLAVEITNNDQRNFALIDIPTNHLPRFIMVPEQKGKSRKTIILLDNIIRFCLDDIFKGFFEYEELKVLYHDDDTRCRI